MTRKEDRGDQPIGRETTWTNTGATRSGKGQHNTGLLGDGMLRHSPNPGTLRLPNGDDDEWLWVPSYTSSIVCGHTIFTHSSIL